MLPGEIKEKKEKEKRRESWYLSFPNVCLFVEHMTVSGLVLGADKKKEKCQHHS